MCYSLNSYVLKQYLLYLSFFISSAVWAQTHVAQTSPRVLIPHAEHKKIAGRDTTIESDTSKENKEPRYYYVSALASVFVNTHGGFAKRFAPGIELGRTYGIFDLGLAMGRLNSLGRDTARYVEFRPTLNVFSQG